jgi:hypothetical protein
MICVSHAENGNRNFVYYLSAYGGVDARILRKLFKIREIDKDA